ncbi:ABC transporter substrate-binding protein [uncultured Robinsoniella sp.]|uniref:ABC transporter substrate-binding protein n=1 Tax=uncultured Robinsoniella sp. TaxID=904190 RepID=UPI00374ED210
MKKQTMNGKHTFILLTLLLTLSMLFVAGCQKPGSDNTTDTVNSSQDSNASEDSDSPEVANNSEESDSSKAANTSEDSDSSKAVNNSKDSDSSKAVNNSKDSDSSESADAVSLKVGTWKTAQTIQPFFYDQFIDKSCSVEVLPFTNPGDQKTALLSGGLDMTGTTLVTAITAAANNEPVRIVSSLCNKCSALVAGVDSGIETEADLKGKTIAYVPGTMHHALLLDVLERNGIDPEKDVELVRIDFFDMGQALADGTIDAFCSGEPYPSEAVKNGYGKILSYPYFDDSIGTINAAMIVTEDTIKNRPEEVQKMVDAHIKATQYLNENQDAWLDKAEEFGTEKDLLKISAENIELCWDIDDAFIQNTKNLAQKMLDLGIITNMPDIDSLFDLTFLENHK